MARFFTRERFGRPQVLAACLLLAFLAQCLWLVGKGHGRGTVDLAEIYRLQRGTGYGKARLLGATPDLDEIRKTDSAPVPGLESDGYDAHHSPLWYLIAAAPLWLRPVPLQPENIRTLHG